MQINFDETMISQAMTESATGAITTALSGYAVTNMIGKIVTDEVMAGALGQAVKDAASRIDTEALTAALAAELQKATIRAALALLQDGVVSTICKLRNISDYTAEDKAARALVKIELFGNNSNRE